MHRYSIDGERIYDDEPEVVDGPALCRDALAAAASRRTCPVCGGQLKPGWLIHPSCPEAA